MFSQCGQWMDLHTWHREGDITSNWTVDPSGLSVYQSVNSPASFFVSDQEFINVRFSGQYSVANDGDDDFVGFVVGYKTPLNGNNAWDFMLLAQKRDIFGGTNTPCDNFFGTVNGTGGQINLVNYTATAPSQLITHTCDNVFPGWAYNTVYNFTCLYTSSLIVVTINGDTLVNQQGCFDAGRFGFYNNSQSRVTYSNFTYEVLAQYFIQNDSVCPGEAVHFNIFCDSSTQNIYDQLLWDMGDGTQYQDSVRFSHVYNTAGIYPVKLKIRDIYGCSDSVTHYITVHPLPPVHAGSDTAICRNDSLLMSGSGAASYQWSDNVVNGSYISPPPGIHTYQLSGQSIFGCTDSVLRTVTVHDLPPVDAGPDISLCAGDTALLAANGASSYNWNNGISDNQAFVPPATAIYSVTGTDGNGCSSRDSLLLTVLLLPPVNAGPDQTVCAGDSVTFSGSGALLYIWNNGITDGVAFVPAGGSLYILTGTDTNGCVNTDSVLLGVNPLPAVDAGPDQALCAGDSISLSGSGALTYTWNNGVNDGVGFVPSLSSVYVVTGTDTNGCVATDSLTLTVFPVPPLPQISAAPDYCAGDTIRMDAPSIPGASYFWGNPAPAGNSEDLLIPDANTAHSGTYSLYVSVNGCVSDTAFHTLSVHPVYQSTLPVSICSGSSFPFLGQNYTQSGQHLIPLSSIHGCDSLIILSLDLLPQPQAGFDMPAEISLGDPSVQISDLSTDALSLQYFISTGDQYNVPDFVYTFTQEGSYSITQIAVNGPCADTLSREITVHPYTMIYIPNSFTPGRHDGTNDEWKPVISYINHYRLYIFNRWGEMVFESENIYEGWNGSFRNDSGNPLPQGTYVYKILYTPTSGRQQELLGHINLLR
ncbi:MAG: gliding motility-associated C-terminal domain-containing protein [Bacteroidia bacterium]|nr:gliding motility-associated C-terminal domain-containing protein [Bacteroidia bacterium]